MNDGLTILMNETPGYLAITLMLFYTILKTANSHVVEKILAISLIIFALFLQTKNQTIKMFEQSKLENRIVYLENALLENNISSKSYEDFKEKDMVYSEIIRNIKVKENEKDK